MSKVYVLGAGADATEGIGMPLTNELLSQITSFLETEKGKSIDNLLRIIYPKLRFRYSSFIQSAIDNILKDFKPQLNSIIKNITREMDSNPNLNDEHKKWGSLILAVFKKVSNLEHQAYLDDEIETLIQDLFGTSIPLVDETILDLNKLVFTDTFKFVLKEILSNSMQHPNDPIFCHVYRNMLDLEDLLRKYFIGFYVGKESQIKTYSYIAWTLWAYLVTQEQAVYDKVSNTGRDLPVYSQIEAESTVITFNYTSFAAIYGNNRNFKSLYFHGSLLSYIDVKTKNEMVHEATTFHKLDILEFFNDILKLNVSFDEPLRYTIPSFLPPINIKPVLTASNITTWYESMEAMMQASKIIIIGYSFNKSDEHFNSILRLNRDKEIIVVDPNVDEILDRINPIFNYRKEDYSPIKIQNKPTQYCNKLKVIQAQAHEIDYSQF